MSRRTDPKASAAADGAQAGQASRQAAARAAKPAARTAVNAQVADTDGKRMAVPGAVVFEPEFVAGLKKIFEEMIVFNQVLGLKIITLEPELVTARIEMRHELVGHYAYNRLHGGVISAGLDAMGGLAVMAAIGARHMDESPDVRLHRFSKLGTIDLRIDYLRPGIGEFFDLSATVMRLGSRVASTRMEFKGPDGKLLSTGAGVYIMS